MSNRTKNKIRTVAVSALAIGTVLSAPAVARSEAERAPRRATPAAERNTSDAAALATYARAHHLTGLSPASLAPLPIACRGLSPASAQNCSTEDLLAATRDR